MELRKTFQTPIALALAVVIASIALSATLSVYLGETVIPRTGATLSAIGAALVVYQAIFEASVTEHEAHDKNALHKVSPFFLEEALKTARSRAEALRITRLQMVVAISLIVFFGEMMHGWGDCLYEFVPHHNYNIKTTSQQ